MTSSAEPLPTLRAEANDSDPKACGVAGIVWVDANGTMWRLRSLVAMGHSATRIATALHVSVETVQKLLRGDIALVGSVLRDLVCRLWDAWWDKCPPQTTARERQAAADARRRAERNDWCTPAGLDEDQLDEPGYRPYSKYRPATGTGIASDFDAGSRSGEVRDQR